MEGVAAAKNLGEEVEETVTLIRKIGLMVDLSEPASEQGGGETISESARERWAEEGNAAIFYLEDNQGFPPPSPTVVSLPLYSTYFRRLVGHLGLRWSSIGSVSIMYYVT